MAKSIHIETIAQRDRYLHSELLSKKELEEAMNLCVKQVEANLDYFKDKFPYSCTKQGQYPIIENIEWTDGFWTGMLWLCYEYTKEEKYRDLAMKNVASFSNRVKKRIALDHHDLGFLYSLSCVSAYKITGSDLAKEAALLAADKLMERWQEKGQFLQAWGPKDSPEHYRFIIDCMMNIPLLYWASEVTGNLRYAEVASLHFKTSLQYVIREDASAFHTFYMDYETGGPSHGATRQGYSDSSSWARGQAWGIYGIPLNTRYTKNMDNIPYFKGMLHYFLNRLPKDDVCYWDLIFNDGSNQSKDSSAAAIAVCGILEMLPYLKNDEDAKVYEHAAALILRSLMQNYANKEIKAGQAILEHGVYSWHSGKGVDEGNIWGDYYYMEAIYRQLKQWNSYW
ncbi:MULTISPECIES: glycoside hydrolase family 88 protein [Terrabacteria group]|uniref:glycoside hydrolase family 88 protein n=1 Tax=Bacillati TaxID=1783272 RepID=UPI0019397136|nr:MULTISPECIES: glycoside hydrolase family 88 protein [Terrabacteria group]MBW9212332.1 glycoside hydrolase family 88 protein [Trueperella sp. zg.1013]QRG86131.1 glycoside hydrolase family 88 protein [Bulleidia sp. zg-1006]